MNLIERLNVLVQAVTLSQKSGSLTLDEAVKAKSAIDVISSGVLNQNYAAAINVLIEIAVETQKKGAYTLKDAYMVYLAVEGIEGEFQNEINRVTEGVQAKEMQNARVFNPNTPESTNNGGENTVTIAPKKLKKKS